MVRWGMSPFGPAAGLPRYVLGSAQRVRACILAGMVFFTAVVSAVAVMSVGRSEARVMRRVDARLEFAARAAFATEAPEVWEVAARGGAPESLGEALRGLRSEGRITSLYVLAQQDGTLRPLAISGQAPYLNDQALVEVFQGSEPRFVMLDDGGIRAALLPVRLPGGTVVLAGADLTSEAFFAEVQSERWVAVGATTSVLVLSNLLGVLALAVASHVYSTQRQLRTLASAFGRLDQGLAVFRTSEGQALELYWMNPSFQRMVGEYWAGLQPPNAGSHVVPSPTLAGRWLQVQTQQLHHTERHEQIWLVEDITDTRDLENQLREAQLQVQQRLHAKEKMFAEIAHEIRTPLVGLEGVLELLDGQALSGVTAERVRIALSAAHSLHGLVDEVLDYSTIEAGKLSIDPRPVCMDDLLYSTVELFRPRVQPAVDLRLVRNALPRWLLLDGQRVRQVLSNLLGNAAKFTASGSIVVDASYIDGALEVAVVDTGIGIERSQWESIFEPFEQSDSDVRKRHGGTGLGLALVRSMVNAMGGSVRVTSEVGRGSRFVVRIPTEPSMPASDRKDLPTLRGLSVLVIDDEQINRHVLQAMLEHLGAQASVASGLEDACQAVSQAEVDVILMDLRMPEADGFEVTRALLERFPERVFVIYGLSASVSSSDRERARLVGMVDLVSKPLSLERLATLVLGHGVPPVRELDTPIRPVDREVWTSVVGVLAQPQGFLDRYAAHLETQLRALEEAAEAGNVARVREIGHAIKGASGSIGAVAVQHWAAGLERTPEDATVAQVVEAVRRGRKLSVESLESLRGLLAAREA